jgi:hypothetical protein
MEQVRKENKTDSNASKTESKEPVKTEPTEAKAEPGECLMCSA